MANADSLAILNAFFDAFNRNDREAAAAFVTDDVVYTVRGRSPLSGTYRGYAAFAGIVDRVKELTDGSMTVTPEVVLADGDNVMMYLHLCGRRPDGRSYDNHQAYLYRLRDGKLAEGQTIPVDQHAFDTFFAD